MQKYNDWDPRSNEALNEAVKTYDGMRENCPVAYSDYLQWSVFRHADITAILTDYKTFSSQVSHHLSVPNGMDPPKHGVYRQLINPYFSEQAVRKFAPTCQEIAHRYVNNINHGNNLDFMTEFAWPVAVAMQCAFLGWSNNHLSTLIAWVKNNQKATLAQDREELAECAKEFEVIVSRIIERHKNKNDVTGRLLHEKVDGKPISRAQLISILRNWAVGEIGTIASAMSILVQFLAEHLDIQKQLRDDEHKIAEAIEEILRLHGPLVTNRRKTTCPVKVSDREIPSDSIVSLNWVSANRDESVFEQAEQFRWGRDQSQNLLYGLGIHICPGTGLARMELNTVVTALLNGSYLIESAGETTAAHYPASGYETLPIRVALELDPGV